MRPAIFASLLAAATVLAGAATAVYAPPPPPRLMALTFDDLPYVGPPAAETLQNAERTTAAILRALASHKAPAVAFVNESRLHVPGEVDARIALLQRWIDGGAILGNHTYSHPDFNALTIEQFEDEIIKGEVVCRRLMQPHEPYQKYFRHPQTHTGDTREKKEAIEGFLAARGYKVAPHTIDSSDYIFNVGYVEALAAKDADAASRVRDAYVAFVVSATEFAETISPQVFGREIAQTLLLHANDLNADSLYEFLGMLERRGYRFVPLDEAMADPAYATRDTYVTTFGPSWLSRWNKSQGMSISFRGDPEPPEWVTDLYARPSRAGAPLPRPGQAR